MRRNLASEKIRFLAARRRVVRPFMPFVACCGGFCLKRAIYPFPASAAPPRAMPRKPPTLSADVIDWRKYRAGSRHDSSHQLVIGRTNSLPSPLDGDYPTCWISILVCSSAGRIIECVTTFFLFKTGIPRLGRTDVARIARLT